MAHLFFFDQAKSNPFAILLRRSNKGAINALTKRLPVPRAEQE
jgi:hypothetical protein